MATPNPTGSPPQVGPPPMTPQQQLVPPPPQVTTQQQVPPPPQGGNTGASVTTGVPFSYPPVIPPDEPNMGGLTKQAGYEVAWMGGKPNSTWTRLDSSASQFPLTPNQLRSERISDSMKSYNYRKTGLVTLYDAKKDLMSFKSAVKKHLKDTGMDTIAYINDLQSPTKMYHVVDQHNRLI